MRLRGFPSRPQRPRWFTPGRRTRRNSSLRLARPYLLIQRQFEDDDGGVCYIETHDHDAYTGHFRLRLIDFTPTRLSFEIARQDHNYVEVSYQLDAELFREVQRIVRIIFGVRG